MTNKNLMLMIILIVVAVGGYLIYQENSGTKVELNTPAGKISGKVSD